MPRRWVMRWVLFRERRLPFWFRYRLAMRRGRLDEIKRYHAEKRVRGLF